MTSSFNDSVILFGGSSEERLVSVASAQNLSNQIPEAKLWFLSPVGKIHLVSNEDLSLHKDTFTKEFFPAGPVIHDTLKAATRDLKGKTVIIGLHGTEGEDGKIQAIFEEAGIKYTGTRSKQSALAFDKIATKEVARKNNLPVVEELKIKNLDESQANSVKAFLKKHGKIVLKPSANGSSVGLFIITKDEEIDKAIDKVEGLGFEYLAEPFITGREITVGVRQKIDGSIHALPCSEVRVIQGRQFDYEGKYLGKGVEELTPAPLTADETKTCQSLALKLHELIGCRGYTRTDMILTEKGPILLEINTLPGLSKASFIPQQLHAAGENLRNFFEEQISLP